MTDQQINVYKKIKSIIEGVGGEILSPPSDYKNSKSKLLYKCGYCNRDHLDTYPKIANRKGYCNKCTSSRRANYMRNSQSRIEEEFSAHGVTLLGKYEKNSIPLDLECYCGRYFKRKYVHVKRDGYICSECKRELKYKGEMDLMIASFVENNCTVISHSKYHGKQTSFLFKCSCENIEEKRYDYYILNPYCKECTKRIRGTGVRNRTNNEIKKFVEDNSECKLLSKDYENRDSVLLLRCKCGEEFRTYFPRFQYENKRQCNDCGINQRSGENAPRWKGGVTPENDRIRKSKEYRYWRSKVFKRDNYTCQCCGDDTGGNLHAHHILNLSENLDKVFDVKNSVTLCSLCHSPEIYGSFHHTYGTRNNDIYQLQEYFDDIRSHLGLSLINIESIVNKTSNT